MNLNVQVLPGAAITPPAPTNPPSDEQKADATEQANQRAIAQHKAFEQMLEQELNKKQQLQAMPIAPWLLPQVQAYVPSDGEDDAQRIEAAEALQAAGNAAAGLRAKTPLLRTPAADPNGELEVAKIEAIKERNAREQVPIVVEAGLPPIQPRELPKHDEPVPIADFPQLVTAQVTQMVKNDQPVTQLDLEISPPQIGPVNLQVSLENGAVNVQLVALTMQAKQSLESHVGAIQQILQSHSFQPGEIRVVTAASGKAGAGSAGQKGEPGMGFFQGGKKRSGGPNDLTVGVS